MSIPAAAQESYKPSKSNNEARELLADAKYDIFIPWGAYSVMAGGGNFGIAEWIMNQQEIPIVAYDKPKVVDTIITAELK